MISTTPMARSRRFPFRRPFAGIHWTVLISIVFAWTYILFWRPCNKGPFYFEYIILCTTISAALVSGFRLASEKPRWARLASAAANATWDLFLFVVVIGVVTSLFLPAYQCVVAK